MEVHQLIRFSNIKKWIGGILDQFTKDNGNNDGQRYTVNTNTGHCVHYLTKLLFMSGVCDD
jgi:hypothetical protein